MPTVADRARLDPSFATPVRPSHDRGPTPGAGQSAPDVRRRPSARRRQARRQGALPAEVSYYKDVRPIFQQHCQGCHQPAKPSGGFVMTELRRPAQDRRQRQARRRPRQARQELPRRADHAATATRSRRMPQGQPTRCPTAEVELVTKWIAQGAKDDTPASARDVIDAEHPPVYELPPVITSLAYSPDGKLLAVAGYHEVLLHKADGSGLVGRLVGLSERIQSLAFSPDGKLLAVAGGSPGRFGEVQIWDVAKQKLKLSRSVTFDTLYGVSWSPDGTKVAFGCADNTRAGHRRRHRQAGALPGRPHRLGAGHRLLRRTSKHLVVGQPRHDDEADRGGHAALHRQRHQHHARRAQGRPAGRGPRSGEEREEGQGDTAAGERQAEKCVRRAADRRLRRHAAAVQDAPRDEARHRRRRQQGPRVSRRCRAGSSTRCRSAPTASLFAAGSSLDGTGEVRVYQTRRRQARLEVRGRSRAACYAVAFSPDGKWSPPPASTAWCG